MSKTKPMYYVYHVPGIKVGMTKDLGDRVFEQQGYDPHEIELLFVSRDMEAASKKELEYQRLFELKEDRQSYKIGCLEEISLNNGWIIKKNIQNISIFKNHHHLVFYYYLSSLF